MKSERKEKRLSLVLLLVFQSKNENYKCIYINVRFKTYIF